MSNANFNRRRDFISIGNCPRCNHYPTQFIGEPGNVKCYALPGMATVHLRRVLNELIATGNAQTSTRQEAIQYMGEFDSGPDVADGHDHEGFPGGCERFGHTPETCPESSAVLKQVNVLTAEARVNTTEIRKVLQALHPDRQPAGVVKNDLECGDIDWIVQNVDGGDFASCGEYKSVAEYINKLEPYIVNKLCDDSDQLAAIKRGKIGGFAPGRYHCKCTNCRLTFLGDKRSVQCLACAMGFTEKMPWEEE